MLLQHRTSGFNDRIKRSILALEIRIGGSLCHIGEFSNNGNKSLAVGCLLFWCHFMIIRATRLQMDTKRVAPPMMV